MPDDQRTKKFASIFCRGSRISTFAAGMLVLHFCRRRTQMLRHSPFYRAPRWTVSSLSRSDCFRLEQQSPGGITSSHWITRPFHDAR
jgi:hypothetical protein